MPSASMIGGHQVLRGLGPNTIVYKLKARSRDILEENAEDVLWAAYSRAVPAKAFPALAFSQAIKPYRTVPPGGLHQGRTAMSPMSQTPHVHSVPAISAIAPIATTSPHCGKDRTRRQRCSTPCHGRARCSHRQREFPFAFVPPNMMSVRPLVRLRHNTRPKAPRIPSHFPPD